MFGNKYKRHTSTTPNAVVIGSPVIQPFSGSIKTTATKAAVTTELQASLPAGVTIPAQELDRIVSAAVDAEASKRVVMRTIWESSQFSLAAYSFESVSENGTVSARWRAVLGSATASATTTVTTQKEKTTRIIGVKVDRKRSTETRTVARGLTADEVQHVQAVVFEAMEGCAEFKAIADSVETL